MQSVSYAKVPRFTYQKVDPKKLQYTNVPIWTPPLAPGEEEKPPEPPAEAVPEASVTESGSGKNMILMCSAILCSRSTQDATTVEPKSEATSEESSATESKESKAAPPEVDLLPRINVAP